MDYKHISLLAILIFQIVKVATSSTQDATTLCNLTPYPNLCTPLLNLNTTTLQASLDENLFDFRDIILRKTLYQAKYAHKLISNINPTSFNNLSKLAWLDCLELYEHTISHLNRSIRFKTNPHDTQAWLSASIANEQTCKQGFHDFNLSTHYESSFSSMETNFPKFLSNSLAINKAMASNFPTSLKENRRHLLTNDDDLPKWVSISDRKLLQFSNSTPKADIIVAKDGSGNFKTISEALSSVAKRRKGNNRFIIYVKKGIYNENVEVKRSMKNLMFIGDGIDETIVTGSKNVQDGTTTFRSATFAVSGTRFIARRMTFENTAGPQKHQAVALRSSSDFSIFYECSFKGYQDTLYVHSLRQFYRDCDIHGTIDFMFGDAIAVFQNCNIYLRKPMSNQKNTITAQARSDPNEISGIIVHNSRVTAGGNDLGGVKSYLGRPWKRYSRTVFMKCEIDGVIDKEGWLEWSGNFGLSSLYYGEYMNNGSGASVSGRVKWPGFRVISNATEAGKFSVGKFLAGDSWIPAANVPFVSGL